MVVGVYTLLLMVPARLSACKILHCDLNTTLDEVKKMKDRKPGIVYTGTQAETDWMCSRLKEFGFSSSIEKVDDDARNQSIDLSHRLQYPTPRSESDNKAMQTKASIGRLDLR